MAVACPSSFQPDSLDAPFSGGRSSHVATLPSLRDAPTAAGVSSADSWEGIEPDAPISLVARMPEWCVDLGDEMIALHAVELYARLATGTVPPDAKVWRIGREAWTPARDVAELRYAIEDGDRLTPPPPRAVSSGDEILDAMAFAQAG
jgi:hypothetical protein